MRKTVIALIIVLPMVFVLVLFSSLTSVSISVPVSVSGIKIFADGDPVKEGEPFYIDMADMQQHRITAQVEPANAHEKGYTLSSDDEGVLSVDKDGYIIIKGEGNANVKATSNDKAYTAVVPVAVTSSVPYDVKFSLFDAENNEVMLTYSEDEGEYGLNEKLARGKYGYKVDIRGGDSDEYDLTLESVEGVDELSDLGEIVNKGANSVLLPYSGKTVLSLVVKNAFANNKTDQTLTKKIVLDVDAGQSSSGIFVNGIGDSGTVSMATGSTESSIYVECVGEPEVSGFGIKSARCVTHDHDVFASAADESVSAKHKIVITLDEDLDYKNISELSAILTANGKTVPLTLSFSDYVFGLNSGVIMKENERIYHSVILKDTATTFNATSEMELQGVRFEWIATSAAGLKLDVRDNGASCVFTADRNGEFPVVVRARDKDGNTLYTINLVVTSVTKVEYVQINNLLDNRIKLDLVERYTVGGKKFANGEVVANDSYFINISVRKKGNREFVVNDYEGIDFEVSDQTVATVSEVRDGKVHLDIHSSGAITLTAKWKYNAEFGGNAAYYIKLNVIEDAVEVGNYPELKMATEEGYKVVLTKDIMLGTDESGAVLPFPERQAIANSHKYNSTYNTAYYKQIGSESEAKVMYAMEFKNDVYGNGKYLDAEYFTNAVDASGRPLIYMGPLSFVSFGEEQYSAARVAAQDNCAFLIRTDGVKLYGVNLLGCSNESLYDGDNYELNHLNCVGTTLEVNADCEIINCRLQNGRNVLRAYGGNKEANLDPISYYINSVPNADIADEDRIIVNVKGCILTQSREFIVKVGTNRAIKGSRANKADPEFRNESGSGYKETTKKISVQDENGKVRSKTVGTNQYDITDDEFFYDRYVMTDLTLEDSVLETSGLFCIGVESNFAGEVLTDGCSSSIYANKLKQEGWATSGATSFASMLRLVGDVRLYDWKDVSQVDSSTLIESGNGSRDPLAGILSFNISAMLQEVDGQPEYAKLLYKTDDNKMYVHGGIAYYGGGRNYSLIDLSNFNSELNNMSHININIEQFSTSSNPITSKQTRLLPLASGTHDFNFWLYSADSTNNYEKQQNDIATGKKYTGIKKIALFVE